MKPTKIKENNISIYGRKANRDKSFIKKILPIFLEYIFTKKEINNISGLIEFRKYFKFNVSLNKTQIKNQIGKINYSRNYKKDYFYIQIKTNMPFQDIIRALVHELYHLKQFMNNKLKYSENSNYIWKNKKYNINDYKYKDRPWEKETKKIEYKLLKRFFIEYDICCIPKNIFK